MFKISEFSRLTQVTAKALRHYDHLGLLRPEYTDPASGYRYYTGDQVARLDRILALKDLGFSLEQIGQLLDADLSPAQLRAMLLQKGGEVRGAIAAEQARLARIEDRLRQLAEGSPGIGYDIALRPAAARRVASLRDVLPGHRAIGALFGELRAYARDHGLRATDWTAVWHDAEFREADVTAEVTFATIDPLPPHPRIGPAELPAVATLACARHHGPVGAIGPAYRALLGWIAGHGYRLAGPTRTLPLHFAGPDSPDSLIEIQYPVARDDEDGAQPARTPTRAPAERSLLP